MEIVIKEIYARAIKDRTEAEKNVSFFGAK